MGCKQEPKIVNSQNNTPFIISGNKPQESFWCISVAFTHKSTVGMQHDIFLWYTVCFIHGKLEDTMGTCNLGQTCVPQDVTAPLPLHAKPKLTPPPSALNFTLHSDFCTNFPVEEMFCVTFRTDCSRNIMELMHFSMWFQHVCMHISIFKAIIKNLSWTFSSKLFSKYFLLLK